MKTIKGGVFLEQVVFCVKMCGVIFLNIRAPCVCVCSLLSVANTSLLTLLLWHGTRFPGWYHRAKGLLGNKAQREREVMVLKKEKREVTLMRVMCMCGVWWDLNVGTLHLHLSGPLVVMWITVHSQITCFHRSDYTVEHIMAEVEYSPWASY